MRLRATRRDLRRHLINARNVGLRNDSEIRHFQRIVERQRLRLHYGDLVTPWWHQINFPPTVIGGSWSEGTRWTVEDQMGDADMPPMEPGFAIPFLVRQATPSCCDVALEQLALFLLAGDSKITNETTARQIKRSSVDLQRTPLASAIAGETQMHHFDAGPNRGLRQS